jgi:hypothetical protein
MTRGTVAVLMAVLVLAVVLVVVLVFGVIPLPDYPSLADHPDPSIPGTIAFVSDDAASCLGVVPAGGGDVRELRCGSIETSTPAWTTDGLIATLDFTSAVPRYLLLDPMSGQVVDTVDTDSKSPEPLVTESQTTRSDGAVLITENSRGVATVEIRAPNEPARVLITANGPRDYRFDVATWSPDGAWVLVVDSEGRLLIVNASGDPTPKVLVTNAARWVAAAWYIPGYEGFDVSGR